MEEEKSSFGSLDAFISSVDRGIIRVEVPMPPHDLSEKEVLANLQRREHTKYYIQLCLENDGCKPRDFDVLAFLNL